jgi:uncharacterized Zn finger protein (UPF0148 family)
MTKMIKKKGIAYKYECPKCGCAFSTLHNVGTVFCPTCDVILPDGRKPNDSKSKFNSRSTHSGGKA